MSIGSAAFVFPAKAGIQKDCFGHSSSWVRALDSSLRWNDEVGTEFSPNCVLTRKIRDESCLILRLRVWLYRPPYMGLKKLWRKFRPWAQEWQRRSTGSGIFSPDLWVMRKAS